MEPYTVSGQTILEDKTPIGARILLHQNGLTAVIGKAYHADQRIAFAKALDEAKGWFGCPEPINLRDTGANHVARN